MLPELSEIVFDEQDRSLFDVDDLDLRARAIRASILPRLRTVLIHAIDMTRRLYNIDPFVDSHIAETPNFRSSRANHIVVDYSWATAGLSGRRKRDKWLGFSRKSGGAVSILPFFYVFGFTSNGLQIYLKNYWLKGLSDESYEKILSFHIEYETVINMLCFRSGVLPHLHWGEECKPFSSFAEHYRWMINHHRYDNDYSSYSVATMAGSVNLRDIVQQYCIFYPVYDSYLQLAKGEPVRLMALVDCLNQWAETIGYGYYPIVNSTDKPVSMVEFKRVREIAERSVPTTPSLRYQVFLRDGFRCQACGRKPSQDNNVILHVDHIKPRSMGGEDTLDNLQTLCSECNLGKGNRDDTDLRY